MRSSTSFLFPVLAVVFALGVVGMPEGVAAQGKGCVVCKLSKDAPPECEAIEAPFLARGYQRCRVEAGKRNCTLSDKWPDCWVTINPWLDGRVDVGSRLPSGSGQGVVVSGAATPVAVERSACTGAIVQRLYLPARIAELRADLRHVTV